MPGPLKTSLNGKLPMLDPFMGVTRRARFSIEGEIFFIVEQTFKEVVEHSIHLQHLATLQKLEHPNLLRFVRCQPKAFVDGTMVLKTIFEDPGDSLHVQIARRDKPDALKMFELLYSGLDVLSFLSERGVYHGLITPRSLFRTHEGTWKLAMPMFGVNPTEQIIFKAFSAHLTTYASPELFASLQYENVNASHDPDRSDVFSFALCILEFGVGVPISHFYSDRKVDSIVLAELLKKFRNRYAETPLLANTLDILLRLDVKLRPNASAMLNCLPPFQNVLTELQKLMISPKEMKPNPEIPLPSPEEANVTVNEQAEDGLSQASFDTPTFDKSETPEKNLEKDFRSPSQFPQVFTSFSSEHIPNIKDSMDDIPLRVLNFTSFIDIPLYDMSSFYEKKSESKKEKMIKKSFSKPVVANLDQKETSSEKGDSSSTVSKKAPTKETSKTEKIDSFEKSPAKDISSDTDSFSYETENDVILSSRIVTPKSEDLEATNSIIISHKDLSVSTDLISKSKPTEECISEGKSIEDTNHKSRYSDMDERETNLIEVQDFDISFSEEKCKKWNSLKNQKKVSHEKNEDTAKEETKVEGKIDDKPENCIEEINEDDIEEDVEEKLETEQQESKDENEEKEQEVNEEVQQERQEKTNKEIQEDNQEEKTEEQELKQETKEILVAFRPPRPTGNEKVIGGKPYIQLKESREFEIEGKRVIERTTKWIAKEHFESLETNDKAVE